jgi:hypothetical protein
MGSGSAGNGVCSFGVGASASHVLDDFAVQSPGHVIRAVVFDVLRLAELAGPLAVGELTGGVGVEEAKAVDRYLLEARFERFIATRFVPQRLERLF